MPARSNLVLLSFLCLACAGTLPATAQSYPSAPVRFVTPLPAGGGTDPAMRIVIDQLAKLWGQQTALVNQPGAGGAIAARTALAAPPDGYTLLMAIASTYTSLPETQPELAAPLNELVPIGFVGEVPMAVAVTPNLAATSLPELIALSKKQPGGLNVALALRGGTTHLTTELLRIRSGADLTAVFYPAAAQALSDVITGRVHVIIDGLSGPVGAGQVRLLAVASRERVVSRPEIPTVLETFAGVTSTGWVALVAPPRTPAAIVNKIRADLESVLARPDVQQRLDAISFSRRAMTEKQLAEFISDERKLWGPLVKRLNAAP